jgi:hypothetical protein
MVALGIDIVNAHQLKTSMWKVYSNGLLLDWDATHKSQKAAHDLTYENCP